MRKHVKYFNFDRSAWSSTEAGDDDMLWAGRGVHSTIRSGIEGDGVIVSDLFYWIGGRSDSLNLGFVIRLEDQEWLFLWAFGRSFGARSFHLKENLGNHYINSENGTTSLSSNSPGSWSIHYNGGISPYSIPWDDAQSMTFEGAPLKDLTSIDFYSLNIYPNGSPLGVVAQYGGPERAEMLIIDTDLKSLVWAQSWKSVPSVRYWVAAGKNIITPLEETDAFENGFLYFRFNSNNESSTSGSASRSVATSVVQSINPNTQEWETGTINYTEGKTPWNWRTSGENKLIYGLVEVEGQGYTKGFFSNDLIVTGGPDIRKSGDLLNYGLRIYSDLGPLVKVSQNFMTIWPEDESPFLSYPFIYGVLAAYL